MAQSKTKQAIIDLLKNKEKAMCADDIFIKLNPGKKCYSYAAIYNKISQLCRDGILIVEEITKDRRRTIKINRSK